MKAQTTAPPTIGPKNFECGKTVTPQREKSGGESTDHWKKTTPLSQPKLSIETVLAGPTTPKCHNPTDSRKCPKVSLPPIPRGSMKVSTKNKSTNPPPHNQRKCLELGKSTNLQNTTTPMPGHDLSVLTDLAKPTTPMYHNPPDSRKCPENGKKTQKITHPPAPK